MDGGKVGRRVVVGGVVAGGVVLVWKLWYRRKKEGGLVAESTIRLMTRLAIEHNAVNLSQGFPNEAPPSALVVGAATAILGGTKEGAEAIHEAVVGIEQSLSAKRKDVYNQYSFPFGAPCLRDALSQYYERWYGWKLDAGKEITVSSGATEAFASCLRALCAPGDACVWFQPFHELYPSQVHLFYLEPRAVTLREKNNRWTFCPKELDQALRGAKLFLFNSPHNPTGHVFSSEDIELIATLCRKHAVIAVTDEIYEHIRFASSPIHDSPPPKLPDTLFGKLGLERSVLCNSASKTFKATGWRIGWILADAETTAKIRAVHDQLVACSATPLQIGVAAMLSDPGHDPFLTTLGAEYLTKRDLLLAALARAGFHNGPIPTGAYYIFADYSRVPKLQHLNPTQAAIYCIQQVGVAAVPGDNFYLSSVDKKKYGSRYLRFAFVRSLDLLHEAARRLDSHFTSPSLESTTSS